jgi:leader peptidase (prepilin peptidase)/N-methyltransferase
VSGLTPLFATWLALLGLVIGSFLNVIIWRLPRNESIVRPGSHCPSCGRPLRWFENIPLASWLWLRGRCRTCRAPISWRYPAIELLTALLFLACLARFDWTWLLVSALVLVVLLVPLTFIDLEHWLLPFALTLPGIGLGIALSAVRGIPALVDSVAGAAAGFLGFWAMEWVGAKAFQKEALGGGDKYLLALIGAFLSYRALLAVVFLSSLQGALVGVLLLVGRGRAGPEPPPPAASAPPTPAPEGAAKEPLDDWVPGPTNIPFGPWLSLAALEILLLGPWLADLVPTGFRWFVGADALR